MSASYTTHQDASRSDVAAVRCAVITLSDTRTVETDISGQFIREALTAAGEIVAHSALIRDEPTLLQAQLDALLARQDIHAILTTGGTGIARRDNTIGVVERAITMPIPGFGELFRMLSHQTIGSGAMLSRALGGVIACDGRRVLVFSMPGSLDAVTLAMTQLVLPELKHLVWELRR